MICVSAGIIRREDGRILVCQRGEGRSNAHLWEFPGGKQELGERPEACLVRELMEELRLPVKHVTPFAVCEAGGLHFDFLTCEADGVPVATEHEDVRFVQPREMLRLAFCPADTGVARALALNAPPLRHFFWDFDGTLIDTYPMMLGTLMAALAALGIQENEHEVLALQKVTLQHAIDTLTARHSLTPGVLYEKYCEIDAKAALDQVPAIRGISEALEQLRSLGGRHYIVTHRDRASSEAMLKAAGLLAYFDDMVTSDDGLPRKPQPDSCLYLLRKHGIDPQTAVMIGDRPLDTAAGRGAGMLSCLLDEEGRFPDDPCELRADCAAALPDLLCPALT